MSKLKSLRVAGWFVCASVAASLLASPSGAALDQPIPALPASGANVETLPAFGWEPVRNAYRYEWEISADPGFNSPVLGAIYDHFFTRNTRATLTKTIPDGSYWWHVRAVAADGTVGPWSPASSFDKRWADVRLEPTLLEPANGSDIRYPDDLFRLSWTPVPGAARYLVSIATDPALGSLVWTGAAKETQATSYTPGLQLSPDQVYFWGVTPVDSAGNRGAPSAVHSFTWRWNSGTGTARTDLAAEPEIYDWRLAWDPVPGAAGYELDVSTSSSFSPGSHVCCPVNSTTKVTTIGTSYSTLVALPNNVYYWRVRAVDPSRNAGTWNVGDPFLKSFDNVLPSVTGLQMLDNPLPAQGAYETTTPVVTWDAVPGASSYEVEVTSFAPGLGCLWSASGEHWRSATSTTAWTPLGTGWNSVKPFGSTVAVSWDLPSLVAGHSYCVRVTAVDRPADGSTAIRGVEAYLPDENTPAFTWTGPPAGSACTAPCNPNALGDGDYLAPRSGATTVNMPVFRWQPLAGAQSYFVLVSRDADFTNLVDYAFTQVPAYAPRLTFGPKTYADESEGTLYYWAVLPATGRDGSGVTTAPRFSAPQSFEKQSGPPDLLAPLDGATSAGAVTFQWSPVAGARRYRLQVSHDPTFSGCGEVLSSPSCPENITTDSTSFTSSKTYAADTNLYWRVRADAEDQLLGVVGLTWSNEGETPDLRSFRKTLAVPIPDGSNPTVGSELPTWRWSQVSGAVSYDFHLELPNGGVSDFTGLPSAAAVPVLLKGTGKWHWQVRANFPQVDQTRVTSSSWSARQTFTRTIPQPNNPAEDVSPARVLLRWDPRPGAFNYRVQVSSRQDFSQLVEATTTDGTSYAPLLTSYAYLVGGTFYWRVAAADDGVANVGDFTTPRTFTVAPGLSSASTKLGSTTTASVAKTRAKVKVSGSVFPSHPGRTVKVSLYRKRGGTFRLLATRRPVLNSLSRYKASFPRPRRGTCKARSVFAGDADHASSKRTVIFSC